MLQNVDICCFRVYVSCYLICMEQVAQKELHPLAAQFWTWINAFVENNDKRQVEIARSVGVPARTLYKWVERTKNEEFADTTTIRLIGLALNELYLSPDPYQAALAHLQRAEPKTDHERGQLEVAMNILRGLAPKPAAAVPTPAQPPAPKLGEPKAADPPKAETPAPGAAGASGHADPGTSGAPGQSGAKLPLSYKGEPPLVSTVVNMPVAPQSAAPGPRGAKPGNPAGGKGSDRTKQGNAPTAEGRAARKPPGQTKHRP